MLLINLTEIIGVIGLSLILIAFFLNLFHFLSQRSLRYNLMNIIGSSFLAYYSIKLESIPFLILQLVWALLSLYKLIIVIVNDKIKKKKWEPKKS